MIGVIITGHGDFAAGILSSINVIASNPKDVVAVNFDGLDVDKLSNDIEKAFEQFKDYEGIVVLSDITGGSPFKTAVMKAQEYPNAKVIGGANVPLACEIVLSRDFETDIKKLVDNAITSSKESIVEFTLE